MSRLKLLAVTITVAFATLACGATSASTPGTKATIAPSTVAVTDSKAADLRTKLNLLLGEHLMLASKATGAALGGRSDEFAAYGDALNKNGTDIGAMIGSVTPRSPSSRPRPPSSPRCIARARTGSATPGPASVGATRSQSSPNTTRATGCTSRTVVSRRVSGWSATGPRPVSRSPAEALANRREKNPLQWNSALEPRRPRER